MTRDLPYALVTASDLPYHAWQIVVHWAHMRHFGWPTRYLLYTGPDGPSDLLEQIMDTLGADGAHFTVWNDWRRPGRDRYGPGMKPGLVGQWLTKHTDDVDEVLLLLDPDALPLPTFTEAIRRDGLRPYSRRWFGTDTDSYTGPAYLKSKGEDLWVALCDLVGVDPEKAAQTKGRGSQWLFTGMSGTTWLEIADLSEDAYRILHAHDSDVQVWCAEMYVTQIVLIRDGIAADAVPETRMVWANGPRADWETAGFFHNAGITKPGTGHFYKGQFHDRAPFGIADFGIDPGSASAEYVRRIRAAETLWPKLAKSFTT